VVVCLGEKAYRAALYAYGVRPKKFRDAVSEGPTSVSGGVLVFPVYHCGAGTQNRNRSLDAQREDWRRIRAFAAAG
jgi:uracil-DNA glycosylase